jgi:hypothetical protein
VTHTPEDHDQDAPEQAADRSRWTSHGYPINPPSLLPWKSETEEQPPAAEATVPAAIDFTRPYCFRVDQPAPHREEGTFMLSWGTWDSAPVPTDTPAQAAMYEAGRVSIEHSYTGPMRVRVWQRRDAEHYRSEPPADAFEWHHGDPAAELTSRERDLLAQAERVSGSPRLVDGAGCTPTPAVNPAPCGKCDAPPADHADGAKGHLWIRKWSK